MKKRNAGTVFSRNLVIGLLLIVCTLGLNLAAAAQTITTFDAPGATQGTLALGINPAGTLTGYYCDDTTCHGFLRNAQGAITTFDVPGDANGTYPQSINPAGAVTGYWIDASEVSHGFVRAANGTITSFDAPGASGAGSCGPPVICSSGTQGAAINAAGAISGQYADVNGVFHSFVRWPNGTFTSFDAPGAGTAAGQGTFVTYTDGINPAGAVAGGYADSNGMFHGLVRAPDGTITQFDPPGSTFTNNSGINAVGTVTSYYIDTSGVLRGYIRAPNGVFAFFDVPGAGTDANQGTEPLNINLEGDIAGLYVDSSDVYHGFLRTTNGAIIKFDVPSAGTGGGQGTIPICNNQADVISGYYVDASGMAHGFVRTP